MTPAPDVFREKGDVVVGASASLFPLREVVPGEYGVRAGYAVHEHWAVIGSASFAPFDVTADSPRNGRWSGGGEIAALYFRSKPMRKRDDAVRSYASVGGQLGVASVGWDDVRRPSRPWFSQTSEACDAGGAAGDDDWDPACYEEPVPTGTTVEIEGWHTHTGIRGVAGAEGRFGTVIGFGEANVTFFRPTWARVNAEPGRKTPTRGVSMDIGMYAAAGPPVFRLGPIVGIGWEWTGHGNFLRPVVGLTASSRF